MVQNRRLASKQLHHLWVCGKLGANHLDRHNVPGLDIESPINFPHASLCDRLFDFVSAVQSRSRPDAAESGRLKYRSFVHRSPLQELKSQCRTIGAVRAADVAEQTCSAKPNVESCVGEIDFAGRVSEPVSGSEPEAQRRRPQGWVL